MSDFKANMNQIRFRLGLCPRPRWGSLQPSPDSLAGLEGATYVSVHGEHSAMSESKFGVPQGSMLGPILFIMYTADVIRIVERDGLSVHQFADDTQIYSSCQSVTLS